MVSCLGEIKTHLIVGQPQEFNRAPSTADILGTVPGRWGWGPLFIVGVSLSHSTLTFILLISYFSHPFSSLSIFTSIPFPFLPSIPSCFPAHLQSTSDTGKHCARQCLFGGPEFDLWCLAMSILSIFVNFPRNQNKPNQSSLS